jgi:hypothetical protein
MGAKKAAHSGHRASVNGLECIENILLFSRGDVEKVVRQMEVRGFDTLQSGEMAVK